MNREISKQDNNNYAKIYLRADLKKTEIRTINMLIIVQ
jgi:hypothetical protein